MSGGVTQGCHGTKDNHDMLSRYSVVGGGDAPYSWLEQGHSGQIGAAHNRMNR